MHTEESRQGDSWLSEVPEILVTAGTRTICLLETNLLLQTFTVSYHSKHCYSFPPSKMHLTLNTAHFKVGWRRVRIETPADSRGVPGFHTSVLGLISLQATQISFTSEGLSNVPLNTETCLLGTKCT